MTKKTATAKPPKPIAQEIHELRSQSVPELVARYESLTGKPPRIKNRTWLWRRVAWKLQEQRFGGLSQVAKARLDELISELDLPLGSNDRVVRGQLDLSPASSGGNSEPPIGTTLTKSWRGLEIVATRVTRGWEHDGVVHRSLSGLAKAITGSHVNGRAFFGLSKRRSKS